jgi:hypothetical protein
VIRNNGNAIIKNGTVNSLADNGGSAIYNAAGAVLTVEDVTLNGALNVGGGYASYALNNYGIMTVNNAIVTSGHGSIATSGADAKTTLNNVAATLSPTGAPTTKTNHVLYTYGNATLIVNSGVYTNNASDASALGGTVVCNYTESGEITAFGKALTLKKEVYNAAADRATTEREIKALKQRGINCLTPDYPQPRWFYDICDRVGIYVIDCAAVASPSTADSRALGGTPANAPELMDEYLRRVETMYHRAQNHVCIIAFSLGKKAGNGYNLYKAYELLKSKGDSRAIIYEDADGEWNTDVIE